MARIGTSFFSTVSAALIVTLSVGAAVTNAISEVIVHVWHVARDFAGSLVLHAAALAPKPAKVALVPQRLLRAADAMIERQAKRQRPRIESNFRMCPSI